MRLELLELWEDQAVVASQLWVGPVPVVSPALVLLLVVLVL